MSLFTKTGGKKIQKAATVNWWGSWDCQREGFDVMGGKCQGCAIKEKQESYSAAWTELYKWTGLTEEGDEKKTF